MFGACGTVSEKASELPEPVAVARSQSFFVAFSFRVALKMPYRFDRTSATVRHAPLLPCRRWIGHDLLVARRDAAPDADGLLLGGRRRTGTGRPCRLGFARAFSSDDEWKNRPLSYGLGLG